MSESSDAAPGGSLMANRESFSHRIGKTATVAARRRQIAID
jgi:hypothetical protein